MPDNSTQQRTALDTTATHDSHFVDVPEDLGRASDKELLYLALTGDSGGDVVAHGLDSVLCDIEVLYEALSQNGETWAASGLHQIQSRVRVIAELHRRRVEKNGDAPSQEALLSSRRPKAREGSLDLVES